MMAVQAGANAEQVAGAFDWSSVEHVVDVGGGTGVMLHALLAAYPRLRATLFDLPQVVAAVPHENRLDVVAGSVFDDPLPRADAYVLSRILHGWPDSKAEEILELCAAAGGEHVRVLLVESVLSEPPSVDEAGFDLFMLTLTGGRERNLDDFRRVASAAGLELRSSVLLASGSSLLELAR
jgi:hypothetical protein